MHFTLTLCREPPCTSGTFCCDWWKAWRAHLCPSTWPNVKSKCRESRCLPFYVPAWTRQKAGRASLPVISGTYVKGLRKGAEQQIKNKTRKKALTGGAGLEVRTANSIHIVESAEPTADVDWCGDLLIYLILDCELRLTSSACQNECWSAQFYE